MHTKKNILCALLSISLFAADYRITPLILDYAFEGNTQKVIEEIHKGSPINTQDKKLFSTLHMAAVGAFRRLPDETPFYSSKNLETIKALLANGANKAHQDIEFKTPYARLKLLFEQYHQTFSPESKKNIQNAMLLLAIEDEQEESDDDC